jgi:serine/threonine-protein kinase
MIRDLTGRRLGRYEVLAQLASGGMATVYAARAQGVAGFERLVAIKVLHPHLAHDDEFISMFLDEARLAARIRHPNVVPTLDISDSQGDGYFLVMEYIEGDHFGSLLREAARAGKNLPPGVALRVVVDALEGLGAAHMLAGADGKALGIVHRDISPHNILVGSDGIARITDFGVAKAEVRLSSTRDGQFKGKLAYMAPEQASTGFADQRSDLFGMGVVLWESLVGRRLFKAENNGELLNRLLYADIPAPSEYVPELAPLDGVLAKALERDAAARFQTAADFVDAIEAAAAAVGGIGNQRSVGRSVKELLGPKIETESTRIRTAIDSLGRSEVSSASVPRPEPSGLLAVPGQLPSGERIGSQSQPSQVRRAAPEDMTVGAKPATLVAEEPEPKSGKGPLIAAGVVVLLLVLAGVGWFATHSGGAEVAATTTAPAPVPMAPTEPIAVPATSPAASADPEVVGADTPTAPIVPATREEHEERGGHRRVRSTSTSMSTSTSTMETTPATTTTTMTAPPPEDDEVIPSPYQ